MPTVRRDGIDLDFRSVGEGPPVVLVMGTRSTGRVWELHQVPALVAAGYRVTVFDNRGSGATCDVSSISMDDLAGDTAAIIETVAEGEPALVAGTSLGARIVQELALARPELLAANALIAAHGRLDHVQRMLSRGEAELLTRGVELPAAYAAAVTALHNLSPSTLADDRAARDWLELFELYRAPSGPGALAQLELSDFPDRTDDYRDIAVPTLVIAFSDDRMIPPALSREVADAIPGAEFREVENCGHYGYLERPEEVNTLLIDFFCDVLRESAGSLSGDRAHR